MRWTLLKSCAYDGFMILIEQVWRDWWMVDVGSFLKMDFLSH